MITLDSILGQPAALLKLRKDKVRQRIAGAYLFSGLDGIGKGTTARAFAAEILCVEGLGCGQCSSCRQVMAGTQPSLKIILPTADRGALPTLKVHQIEEVLREFSFRAYSGGRRFVVVEDIHTGTRESLNRLLKTLEEPPDQATLILTTTSPYAVLPTIASRCRLIAFQSLSASVLGQLRDRWQTEGKKKKSLGKRQSVSSVALPWLAESSRGMILDAEDEADLRAVQGCLDQGFAPAGLEGLFPQGVLLDRRRAASRLGLLAMALRDRMVSSAIRGYPALVPGISNNVLTWDKDLSLGTKFLRLILETQDALQENANIRLAADVFRITAARLLATAPALGERRES